MNLVPSLLTHCMVLSVITLPDGFIGSVIECLIVTACAILSLVNATDAGGALYLSKRRAHFRTLPDRDSHG